MTAARLKKLLAEAEARATFHEAKAATARKEAALFTELLSLHSDVNSRTSDSEQMQADSRSIAISEGRQGKKKDLFLKAIRAKGYTLRSLAAAVGTPPSLLSMQRTGDRPIPAERAHAIETLTGWPADAKHWPGGLA